MYLRLTIDNDDGVIDEWVIDEADADTEDDQPNLAELRSIAESMLAVLDYLEYPPRERTSL